jgi:6-pyruvoyltetrahydropterin/6-carboxytetrahydropterin synthase
MDYADISALVSPLVERYLDHHYLNDTLGIENPTSEEIARWIYYQLAPKLSGLVAVQVDETCTSCCTFEGDKE